MSRLKPHGRSDLDRTRLPPQNVSDPFLYTAAFGSTPTLRLAEARLSCLLGRQKVRRRAAICSYGR